MGLFLIAALSVHWAHVSTISAGESTDRLIAFLTERLPVERLVFLNSRENPAEQASVEALRQRHPTSKITIHDGKYFLGRRKASAFLLRQCESLEQLDSPTKQSSNLYAGRTMSIRWNYWKPDAIQILSPNDPESEAESFPIQHNESARTRLNSVLTLGILRMSDNPLAFNGTGISGTTDDGQTLTGRLKLNDSGMPMAVEYRIAERDTKVICRFQYGLTDAVPSFYPSKISRFVERYGRETAVGETTILELTIATNEIPDDKFLPHELRSTNRRPRPQLLKYKNGVLHEIGHKPLRR